MFLRPQLDNFAKTKFQVKDMNSLNHILRCILSVVLPFLLLCSPQSNAKDNTECSPLHQNRFIELPLGSISADGWLKEMLIRQKNGATGHLDELYPEVMGSRNGWLGGDGDQWERGPYWIDGLLPLAYILDDNNLKAKVRPWVEWMLSSGQENGQFGPSTDYAPEKGLQRGNCQDWWPRMVALKVLQQHYSATGDERVIKLMTNYFRYQLSVIREKPLDKWTFWARHRGSENLNSIYWLYSITKDDFLIELGDIIYSQTEPFTEMFLSHDKLTRVGTIHSVNLAQGIKTPIVYWQHDRDPKYLEAVSCAMNDLERFHGYPNGMFSGDEAIHGNDPTQGIELCEIVEYMYSLETMYRITGNPRFVEALEKVAFNALPAQTTDDYMTRQYFQQVNQINVMERESNFDVNHSGLDGCFGLLTGFPCCTSNMHQGWPKFTQNLWYATPDGGLAATVYSPSSVRTRVAGGVDVKISEITKYPFEEMVTFRIDEMSRNTEFPFVVRIPSWSVKTSVKVNGKEIFDVADVDNLLTVKRKWKKGDVMELSFTPQVRLTLWKENARAVERGPLVYALKIPSEKRTVEIESSKKNQGKFYYEYKAKAPWNYALVQVPDSDLEKHYAFSRNEKSSEENFPWSEEGAPCSIVTEAVRFNSWKEYNGMAGPMPYSIMFNPDVGKKREKIELIPYGCTILRITEFPMVGKHSSE